MLSARPLLRRFASACAATLIAGTTPASPQEAAAAREPVSIAGPEARIQPGDQVSIRILREPELGGVFTVSGNGEITLPRLGRVQVTGFSAGALQDTLVIGYREFLRDPVIEATVLRRIAVQGEVRRPDVYMVDLTVSLQDLLARAGGLTEAGNPRRIWILRDSDRIHIDGTELTSVSAAELRSGDRVQVGRRSWVALNPAVAVSTLTGLISFVIGVVLLVDRSG
jgi:polysaccharide export outer membrane protein